jgi:hypothetical protein
VENFLTRSDILCLSYGAESVREIQDAIKHNPEKNHLIISAYSNTLDETSFIHIGNCIKKAATRNADVLLGNIEYFKRIIEVEDNLFCVDQFRGSNFIVIFKKFFSQFLTYRQHLSLEEQTIANADNIFLMYPFICTGDLQNYSQSLETIEDLKQIRQFYHE